MLVLSRKRDESIIINDDITVTIVDIRGDKVRLGVEAPNDVPVHRREVYEAIRRNEMADITTPKEPDPEPDDAVRATTFDLQTRITHLEREIQQLKDRNKQLEETANQEIRQRETKIENLEATVQKLHADYQVTINNLHNEVDSLQNDASNAERMIAVQQDEIVDLTDCKEHLRQLGQELCGCDHVESPDERAQQIKHILETVRKLADNNLEYQQEITRLQSEDRNDPTILLCVKHQILHTCMRSCYLCDVENKNLRAIKPTI
jgi:carbon storage regulator